MRTREEQEAINKACKFHPETKEELQELVDDPKVYLGDIDTSNVTDMSDLFTLSERTNFSGIETWDTSNVTDMSGMFYRCEKFNQNISAWDVSSVKNMRSMFYACENFKQDLNAWCVREVCYCDKAFYSAGLSYENVKDAFTKEQLLDSHSEKIIDALNNEKKQVKVQEQKLTKGRGR